MYALLGFLLSNAGVNIVDHPFKFLSIIVCVGAIDILSFVKGANK
jgi:hypothetical protein